MALLVKRISCAAGENALPELAHANWVPSGKVSVSFDISHRGTSILLRYLVREPQVRAINTGFNTPVWEDSCVEFFLSLEDDPAYYNFEINAIGTVLGAYGPDRHRREWISEALLEQVRTTPSLGRGIIRNLEGDISWEMDIVLPVKVLCHHHITDIAGLYARANFYKCGDKLTRPHYLSWQPVKTDTPDFHRPEFFGALVFQ
jgi:hypothetical protein